MHLHDYLFNFLIILFVSDQVYCAEYVPVYLWGTSRLSDHVSALHKTSEDSFKDTLLEYARNKPYILVFVEQTLSPEDFAQRDQNGETPYSKLSQLRHNNKVSYNPYVQNPLKAIEKLGEEITEISIRSLISNPDIPKDNILVIDLNDAKEEESRIHMLKRHDSDMVQIYNDMAKQHKNILAIYTARHVSWIEPEQAVVRKSRSLLADEEPPQNTKVFNTTHVLLYFNQSSTSIIYAGKTNLTGDGWTAKEETAEADGSFSFTLNKASDSITIWINYTINGYWLLNNITLNVGGDVDYVIPQLGYAPLGFSYHCGTKLSTQNNGTWAAPNFQIQVAGTNSSRLLRFGDAYDCVGFTSIPIWSGLFVTFILLAIITFGLTMMMDIKTMDRFDDPKGKTITINVAE